MKAIIRKDEDAVSPVIATILMVAITVVLAAVLYVMVSGLITSPGSTPKAFGATIASSSTGANWIITFTSVPTGLTAGNVFLTIRYPSGATAVNALALSSGNSTITYSPAGTTTVTTSTTLSAADTILLSQQVYKTGYQVLLTQSSGVLWGPQTLG